jgi:hypothetical protein
MRFSTITLLFISILLLLGASNIAFAAQSNQGYVEYKISVLDKQTPVASALLNESAQPTGQNGLVQLTLSLASSVRNLTYTRVLNISSLPEIFPYLAGISNQTFSYQTYQIAFTIHIHNTGSVPVTFNGANYQGANYEISATVSYSTAGTPVSASGNIVTLPSGLIYSAQLQVYTGYSLQIQLVATSLPIVDPPSNTFPLGVALFTVGIIGAVGFAVPSVFLRIRSRPQPQPAVEDQPQSEKKPSYWVD